MPNVFDVANYFLSKNIPGTSYAITPLKLQKLVYYAQGWHLGVETNPLFIEDLKAWDHGPVAPDLYQKYKEYGFLTIPPVEFENKKIFSEKQIELLDSVWETYGQYDGKFLEELTHQEDPWINTPRNNIIKKKIIKNFFQDLDY